MTRNNPLISVIIPNYNYGYLLHRVLDSVLSQLGDEDEIIVVDDGSQDESGIILAEYASRHDQMKVIMQANAGAAAARNTGVSAARGLYALMLDADDELLPGALRRLHEALEVYHDAGMILGGSISVYADGRERVCKPTPIENTSAKERARDYLLKKKISISHSCSLFRREILLERPYPEGLRKREDIPVFARLLVGTKIASIDYPLARIYKHADSLRHSPDANEEVNVAELVEAVFVSLPDDCQSLKQAYLSQCYLSLFRSAYAREEFSQALRHYRIASKLDLWQALRWSYLRKALRILLRLS